MVYKVITDFTNFSNIMSKFSAYKYSYIFTNNALYISDVQNRSNVKKNIKLFFNNDNLFITQLDETNLQKEPLSVQDWAKDQLVKADLLQYERDNQQKLNDFWHLLDIIEPDIYNIRKEEIQDGRRDGREA